MEIYNDILDPLDNIIVRAFIVLIIQWAASYFLNKSIINFLKLFPEINLTQQQLRKIESLCTTSIFILSVYFYLFYLLLFR